VDVGITVHVAAHPGSEVQDRRQLERVRRYPKEFFQCLCDLVVERRHHTVQDLDQIEEHVFALIGDSKLLARVIFGLPRGGELGAQASGDAAHLVRRQRRVEPIEHELGNALLLAQDRAPRRFSGMRDEDRFNTQAADEREHLIQACAASFERAERILDAARLWACALLQKVLPPTADAMHFLGKVHDLKPGRKGAHQIARGRRRSPLHSRGKLDPRLRIAVSATDGAHPVLFHEVEERGAPLLAQDVADERAQGMHVLTQRCVLRRKKDLAAIHDEPWILTRAAPPRAVISAKVLRRRQKRLLAPARPATLGA
jgi:hypothetical protein